MLGRLRLTLDQCQDAYIRLAERIFNPKRNKMNIGGKVKDFLLADGRFDSVALEEVVKEIIVESGGLRVDELLQDPDPKCNVYANWCIV